MPFYPSPLKDDGYDIADYRTFILSFGTLADFRAMLLEAHRLGLKVVTELIIITPPISIVVSVPNEKSASGRPSALRRRRTENHGC